MVRPYTYVRFRWWSFIDLDETAKEFKSKNYIVVKHEMPKGDREFSLGIDHRNELTIKSDTLTVRLSSFRAYLSQNEAAPFTKKDMELRKRMLELFPRNRPTPFPWDFILEPKFEVAE